MTYFLSALSTIQSGVL